MTMLSKLNPWQAIAAFGILVAGAVVLVVTGHEAALPTVGKVLGWLAGGGALAALNVAKSGGSDAKE